MPPQTWTAEDGLEVHPGALQHDPLLQHLADLQAASTTPFQGAHRGRVALAKSNPPMGASLAFFSVASMMHALRRVNLRAVAGVWCREEMEDGTGGFIRTRLSCWSHLPSRSSNAFL